MTNEEAKFTLTAYRPGGRDAGDPQFAGALTQAKQDPALGAWFARSQAHDGAVAAKLGAIAVPAGLREAILAGARASAAPRSTSRRWSPAWLAAAAAAIVVGIALGLWQSKLAARTEQFADSALDDMRHGQHGGHGAPEAALQRWLGSAEAKLTLTAMPVNYDELRRSGCRTLAIRGREVLEVCFTRGGAEYHVYIMPRDQMPGLPEQRSPALVARVGGGAAVWSDARYSYALVSPGGADAIRRLL